MPRRSASAIAHLASVDSAAVAEALEVEIVLGRRHPRERLVEDDLMSAFNAKRHVVREALALLEQMGLVERRRHIGAVVRSFEPHEVVELYELRELLETQAARRIALPLAAADLQRLTEIQQRHDAAVLAGQVEQVFRSNLDFHATLFGLCGNAALTRAIAEYARQAHAIRFGLLTIGANRERARQEHWQMIEALRSGDRQVLEALCRGHLEPSLEAYLHAYPSAHGAA